MKSFLSFLLDIRVAVLLLCLSQVRSQAVTSCPSAWTQYVSNTNQVTCVWLSNDKASWIDAMNWCKVMDGHLVEIGSWNFNAQIMAMIQVKQTGKYWIGLTDVEREREFKWMTSKLPPTRTATFFKPGQQTSVLQKNCVSTDEKGEWTVESCKAEFFFVCQKN